jgi:hypothetical protein
MRYEDFTIQIGPDRGNGHPVQVLKSPAGEGTGVFEPPFAPGRWQELFAELIRGEGDARGVEGTRAERDLRIRLPAGLSRDEREIGDQLFRALFSGPIRTLWDQSLGTVRSRPGWGLRIKLKLDVAGHDLAHLASLPWELLWQKETEDFLSLSRHSPFVRYLDVPRPVAPIRVGSKLRILVATSSPGNLASLNLAEEKKKLKDACRHWKGVDVQFLDNAEPGSVRQALLSGIFHVFHFMGHGGFDATTGEGALYFERAGGEAEAISGRALATFLKDFKSLGLVLLNACDTGKVAAEGLHPFSGVASALVLAGMPAVIAMQFPISDQAAIAFSAAFYQRLALGDPLDAAVVEGRQAVLSAESRGPEWATPVLLSRAPDANVFVVSGGRRNRFDEEESESGRTRLWRAAMAGALALALGLMAVPAIQHWRVTQESAPEALSFDIGRGFDSTLQGLSGTLTRIEFTRSGHMRLYFRFRNASVASVGLGFDYRKTYLADKAGNRYAVLAADGGGTGGEVAVDQVRRGAEVERWIEFPTPRDGARNFNVGLVGYEKGPTFPLFKVDLPEYPSKLSRSTPPPQPAAGSTLLPMARDFATGIEGLEGSVRNVELLAAGRMRWRFAFLNGSNRDQPISFDYSKIYLRDEFGNEYPLLAADTGGGTGQYYRELLQQAVRADHWFEFGAPINGAREFTVVLASRDRGSLRFLPFKTQVPYYPPRYIRTVAAVRSEPQTRGEKPAETPAVVPELSAAPVEPPPPAIEEQSEPRPAPASAPVRYQASGEWQTSIPGLRGGVSSIESLNDGRLRWTIEFQNHTGGSLEVGFNFKETYLSDNLGHRYRVVGSDAGGSEISRTVLADGERVRHWVDFPAPAADAHQFLAVFISHSPAALRFLPLQVELPASKK